MSCPSGANKVTNLEIPWLTVVMRADKDWSRGSVRELEYEFPKPGRCFYANPYERGPYHDRPLITEQGEPMVDEFGRIMHEEDGRRRSQQQRLLTLEQTCRTTLVTEDDSEIVLEP